MLSAARPLPADYDVEAVRRQFPCLHQEVHGRPLVYLDSATSAQKPRAVIDAIVRTLSHDYANIHRGVHTLSQRATDIHEACRERCRSYLNAGDRREIVFTRNGTEGINLVAQSFVRPRIEPGDEVLITAMEHHANIVPWQLLAETHGLKLVVAPINDAGEVLLDELIARMSKRTRLVAVPWVSNALGTINPVHEIVEAAHRRDLPVLIDACQAVQHIPVDVRALDCDFLVFSGHKVYGPSGIGALYGKEAHLEAMPPYQGGGDMILSVTFEHTDFNELPFKFEAGTPAIEAAGGLTAALDFVDDLGREQVARHEAELLAYATAALEAIPGLHVVGTARQKCSVISFVMEGAHPHDIGTLLDLDGIAIRTGHHCAQPLLERLGHTATARASFGLYNTPAEVDALAASLRRIGAMFA